AVSTRRRTSSRRPDRRHWAMALCSESTGTIWPGEAAEVTTEPPTISDSLFARARVLPAASAASVGRSPMLPVMPLSTTSAPLPATALAASGPTRISGMAAPGPASSAMVLRTWSTASGCATATCSTPSATAWRARRAGSDPAALIARTRKASGLARTIRSACVPIEPVDPRSVRVRGGFTGSLLLTRRLRRRCGSLQEVDDGLAGRHRVVGARVPAAEGSSRPERQHPRGCFDVCDTRGGRLLALGRGAGPHLSDRRLDEHRRVAQGCEKLGDGVAPVAERAEQSRARLGVRGDDEVSHCLLVPRSRDGEQAVHTLR